MGKMKEIFMEIQEEEEETYIDSTEETEEALIQRLEYEEYAKAMLINGVIEKQITLLHNNF